MKQSHPRFSDSQGQETFLAPSEDKQTNKLANKLLQSAQTAIPLNHHNVLGLSQSKIKW